MDMVAGRRWAGKSSRCEDTAPTVGIVGRMLRCILPQSIIYATRASSGTA